MQPAGVRAHRFAVTNAGGSDRIEVAFARAVGCSDLHARAGGHVPIASLVE